MTAEQQAALKGYLADAESKLAELPERIEEEAQRAKDEQRRPRPIRPLTEVDPAIFGVALKAIGTCPEHLKEAHRTQSRVCRTQSDHYALLSEQCAGLLNAAGIGTSLPGPQPQ